MADSESPASRRGYPHINLERNEKLAFQKTKETIDRIAADFFVLEKMFDIQLPNISEKIAYIQTQMTEMARFEELQYVGNLLNELKIQFEAYKELQANVSNLHRRELIHSTTSGADLVIPDNAIAMQIIGVGGGGGRDTRYPGKYGGAGGTFAFSWIGEEEVPKGNISVVIGAGGATGNTTTAAKQGGATGVTVTGFKTAVALGGMAARYNQAGDPGGASDGHLNEVGIGHKSYYQLNWMRSIPLHYFGNYSSYFGQGSISAAYGLKGGVYIEYIIRNANLKSSLLKLLG